MALLHVAYLRVDGDQLGFRLELELSHSYEVLVYLGQPLLASVLQVFRKELELLRHLLQRFGVISGQLLTARAKINRADETSKGILHA